MNIFRNITFLIGRSASVPIVKSKIKGIIHVKTCAPWPVVTMRYTQTESNETSKDSEKSKYLSIHCFDSSEKEKEAFLDILRKYVRYNTNRRGILRFIKVSLEHMKDYGVHKDLDAYKAIFDVLPKGPYVPKNRYQFMLFHYKKHHDSGVEILDQMERYGVIPDEEMEDLLIPIFGRHSHVLRKYWRMMYWMPRFCNLNPWPAERDAKYSLRELAVMAVKKMSSVDVNSVITEFETSTVKDAIDITWIISGMSRSQEELLKEHPTDKSIFVEGPFSIWVADNRLSYFVLRGDPHNKKSVYQDLDDVKNIEIPFWEQRDNLPSCLTVHEQSDGIYFALCVTGTSSKDSLLSWIRCLQKKNPCLQDIPVIFKLASSVKEKLQEIEDDKEKDREILYVDVR